MHCVCIHIYRCVEAGVHTCVCFSRSWLLMVKYSWLLSISFTDVMFLSIKPRFHCFYSEESGSPLWRLELQWTGMLTQYLLGFGSTKSDYHMRSFSNFTAVPSPQSYLLSCFCCCVLQFSFEKISTLLCIPEWLHPCYVDQASLLLPILYVCLLSAGVIEALAFPGN